MATPPERPDVVVVGEALIDLVDDDVTVTEHVGGSPANVALGLGRRGARVALLTQLAPDARGHAIARHLEASNVAVMPQSFSLSRTSTALAVIASDGQAAYEFDVQWNELPDVSLGGARVVHTGSIAAFLEPGASSVRALLARSEATEVTFDPNIRPALLGPRDDVVRAFEQTARLATVVKLSDEDGEWLYPGLASDELVDSVLGLGCRVVAVTLGAGGAILANAGNRVRVPAVAVAAVDTIGAGDTFMASLIHSVLQSGSDGLDGSALERMGAEAARAAAITVSRPGADLPWARELSRGASQRLGRSPRQFVSAPWRDSKTF